MQGLRARTDEQKQARRETILAAANQHFMDAGFEGFSMAVLARSAEVAKGTLYLYFKTREEVLLALFCEKLEAWEQGFSRTLPHKPTDHQIAQTFWQSAMQDPAFPALAARLQSVIEHNISTITLVDSKRTMHSVLMGLADHQANNLAMTEAQSFDAITSLSSLLIGASQMASGPSVDEHELPADVLEIMCGFDAEQTFVNNACRILHGIRTGIQTLPNTNEQT